MTQLHWHEDAAGCERLAQEHQATPYVYPVIM